MILLQNIRLAVGISVAEGDPGVAEVVFEDILVDHLPAVGAAVAFFVLDEGDGEGGGRAVAIGVFIETRHDAAVEVMA